MSLRPLHDMVVVRRKPTEGITRGGIIIPEVAKQLSAEGTVVAVGAGYEMPSGFRVPPGVKPGDRVVFAKYAGTDREVEPGKKRAIASRERELVAFERHAAAINLAGTRLRAAPALRRRPAPST